MHLAYDRDQWRAVLNTIKWAFGFHKERGFSWLAKWFLASQ
jgi:hypothetical protein